MQSYLINLSFIENKKKTKQYAAGVATTNYNCISFEWAFSRAIWQILDKCVDAG